MKRSSVSARIRAKNSAARRRQILRILLDRRPLLIGSVYVARIRCGNPRCHCADGPSHPKTLLVYSDRGKRRCKLVRQADVVWVREAAERYRAFRQALRELHSIGIKEIRIFRGLARARAIRYE